MNSQCENVVRQLYEQMPNPKVVVAVDDTVIYSKKSMILAPGEMVNVKIDPEKLIGVANAKAINVRIEVPEA